MLPEPLIIGGHALTQHFTDGLRERRRLEEIERDAEKERTRARCPEGIDVRRIRIQHLRDPLQVIQASLRFLRDVVERVPPGRPPILGERIEEIARLPRGLPEAGGCPPVLALDVDADHRVRPVEKIRDDDARPLARSRRGGETHPLLTVQHQAAPAPRPEDDPAVTQKPGAPHLPACGEARITVKRSPARHEREGAAGGDDRRVPRRTRARLSSAPPGDRRSNRCTGPE